MAVGGSTVYRTKRRFVEGNLEAALNEEPRAGADRKLTGNEEALLIATACSSPPAGRARWTLELLAGAMVKLTDHDSLSRETVRRRLAENHLKPWQKDMWCIPKVDAEYVARMEDVLDLYAEAPDPKRPVVCFDESPTQLIGEARQPIPAAPGRLERFDYEYRRNGTVNLFVFVDAHRSWRRVKVTDRRTADDFALCMRELVDVDFPEAERIRVVLDNLSTHTAAALYAAFPPAEARRVLRRIVGIQPARVIVAGKGWLMSRRPWGRPLPERRCEMLNKVVKGLMAACVAVSAVAASVAPGNASAFFAWRVSDVPQWDTLNVRAWPSSGSRNSRRISERRDPVADRKMHRRRQARHHQRLAEVEAARDSPL